MKIPTTSGTGRRVAVSAAILLSLGLGFALGTFVARSEPAQVIREVVEVPVEMLAEDVPPPEVLPVEQPRAGGPAAGRALRAPALQANPASPPRPTQAEAPALAPGLEGLSGLSGLGGPNGPSGGPSAEATPSGNPLTQAQIERTVASYQGSVKRGCWQPALEGRAPSAPTTARVSLRISVSPAGTVIAAASSGDPPGYPGLGGCIEARVRAFRFPPAGGTTEVTLPFVFAAL